MPWIKEESCVGCSICIEECPVNAINLNEENIAVIDEDNCIRCGRCHDVCPQEAVRHDSEKIPVEVEKNMHKIRILLRRHYPEAKEKNTFLDRMMKYYKMQQKVLALSMDKLQNMIDNIKE